MNVKKSIVLLAKLKSNVFLKNICLFLFIILTLKNCTTVISIDDWGTKDYPIVYSGVRWYPVMNPKPVTHPAVALIYWFYYISLPFSFILDTVLLPLSLPIATMVNISEYEAKNQKSKSENSFSEKEESNLKEILEFKNRKNLTQSDIDSAFIAAIEKENWDLVKYLLEKNANIHAKIPYTNRSILNGIYENGNIEIFRLIFPKLTYKEKKDALIVASMFGNIDIVKFLIQNKVNPNSTVDGYSPLMRAAFGHLEVVKYLVENRANVNAIDPAGYTSLGYAARFCQLKVVQYLIQNGAKMNHKANNGYSILKESKHQGCNNGTVEYLESIGAK